MERSPRVSRVVPRKREPKNLNAELELGEGYDGW